MEMIVPVAALREGDVIIQRPHNLQVVEVQVARFDQIKVQVHLGDPKSIPSTHFYDVGDSLRILRVYKRPDGTPMPEFNSYDRLAGDEWDEGMRRYRLDVHTDGHSVWAAQEPIGFSAAYYAQKK